MTDMIERIRAATKGQPKKRLRRVATTRRDKNVWAKENHIPGYGVSTTRLHAGLINLKWSADS